jgi:hypothetical protein
MGERVLPAPDAPGEEWGRLAVSMPGWRWMPGMRTNFKARSIGDDLWLDHDDLRGSVIYADPEEGEVPDPDDPATGGCLFDLLGGPDTVAPEVERYVSEGPSDDITSLGRACIAAAAALGRWPGGTP